MKQDQEIEYLFIDENPFATKPNKRPSGTFGPLPMRTGFDKLLYGCGAAYLAGLTYGGVYGTIRGLQTAQLNTFNVRMNSILNQSTRYGPWAANSMGIMTMGWAIIDNTLEALRGTNDYYNHIGSAFLSGFIFKSTAGLKPAFLTGSILASIVSSYGLYDAFKKQELSMFSLDKLFKSSYASIAS